MKKPDQTFNKKCAYAKLGTHVVIPDDLHITGNADIILLQSETCMTALYWNVQIKSLPSVHSSCLNHAFVNSILPGFDAIVSELLAENMPFPA